MKLTPNDVASLKDTSKWADFTFEDESLIDTHDDGTNF